MSNTTSFINIMHIITAELPIEMLDQDDTIREEFIEARTGKTACMQFNNINAATGWVQTMKDKYGASAPDYKLYLVEKTTTRTLINA